MATAVAGNVNNDLHCVDEKTQEEAFITDDKETVPVYQPQTTNNYEQEIYIEIPDKSPKAPNEVLIHDDDCSDSEHGMIHQNTLLLEDENDLNQPLPLPFKSGCINRMWYHIKSFFVIHPRFYALYLLYRSTWPRGLVILICTRI